MCSRKASVSPNLLKSGLGLHAIYCLLQTFLLHFSPFSISQQNFRLFQQLLEISCSLLQPKGMNENWSKPVLVIPFPTASDWSQDAHVNQFWTMRLKGKSGRGISLSRKQRKKRQAQLGKGLCFYSFLFIWKDGIKVR